MATHNAVIEITDSKVRLIIGNVVDGKPVICYAIEKPIYGMVSRGEIIEYNRLIQTISSLAHMHDEDVKLNLNVSEAYVILPPIGFEVFETNKVTNVVSPTSIIESIDIRNVMSLVKKEIVPPGQAIVDIIPDAFILEGDRSFANPPIGEKSNSITLYTKIHTLPSRLLASYTNAVRNSQIRPSRSLLAPYCLCEYIKTNNEYPKNYILVDCNAGYSSISLIGNSTPFSSDHVLLGYNDLVLKISQAFQITEEKAKEVLDTYGLDERNITFNPVIVSSQDEFGHEIDFVQDDLNKLIREFTTEFLKQLDSCYLTLLTGYSEEVRKLPIVVTGELINVHGIKKVLESHFTNSDEVIFVSSDIVGARGPEFATCVGALLIGGSFKGSLSEERAKVSELNRVE
ncbi:MAG: hypothetical protein MJ221_01405 [Bacilli bacterium]|nr:hypothetical protein [Bacilli bacterium]